MKIKFYFLFLLSSFICSDKVFAQASYCIPTYTVSCSAFGDEINTFTLIGDNNTAFLDTNTGCSSGAYDNRTAETPVQMAAGNTYSGYISTVYSSGENVRIWIDFNDDGTFSNAEAVGTLGNFGGTSLHPYSISIPTGSTAGSHRMRVRLVYNIVGGPGNINPCSNYTYGETHDYTVIISVPPPTITGNDTICSGSALTLTAHSTLPSPVFNWTGPNSFTAIGATITVPNISAINAGYYYCTVTSAGSTSAADSVAVVVIPTPATPLINSNTPLCTGDMLTLFDTINFVAGYTSSWTGPANFTSSQQNPVINSVVPSQGGTYRLVTNNNGCLSTPATTNVIVNVSPAIVLNPFNAAICPNGFSSFHVIATGATLYQWQVNTGSGFNNISNGLLYSGTTTDSLVIMSAPPSMAGYLYRCVASTICGTNIISSSASLNIYVAAAITSQPLNDTVCEGSTAFFSFNATGSALQYQWQENNGSGFVNITNGGGVSGVYADTLVYTYVPLSLNGGQLRCLVTAGGCAPVLQTNPFTVTVHALPNITTQPVANTTCAGSNASYTVIGTGYNLNYQWQVDPGTGFTNVSGAIYSGANTATLTITGATSLMNNYNYRCVLSNVCTIVNSNAAPLFITAAPTASITPSGSTTFCPNDSLLILAGQNASYSYQWSFNNSNIPSATNPTYIAHATGTYKVTISYGNNCPVSSSNVVVTVLAAPIATLSAGGPTTFCQGGSVALNGNTGLAYTWYLNGTLISGVGSSSYNATSSGTYVLNTYNGSCHSNSAPVTVTVNPVPAATVNYTGTGYFCTGADVELPASQNNGFSYQWYSSGSPINGATNVLYFTSTSGTYDVVVTNTYGCKDTSASITLTAAPIPPHTITVTGATTICAGNSAMLNGPTGTNLTYQWYVDDTVISGAAGTSYLATTSGNYSLWVTNLNGLGCTDTSNVVNITVTNNPLPAASITYTGNPTICYGKTLTLNANTGAGYTYTWLVDSTLISGATASSYVAHNSGHYEVMVTNANGCIGTSSIINLTVDTPITPTVVINGAGIASTGSGYTTYQWYKNGTTPIPGATSYTYNTNHVAANYSVTVTDPAGCSNTSNSITVLGISNVNEYNNDVTIYPNPASSVIYIQAAVKVNVSVYSIQGKMILQKQDAKDLNISDLASGFYMIQVFDEDNNLLKVERFVKNNQ